MVDFTLFFEDWQRGRRRQVPAQDAPRHGRRHQRGVDRHQGEGQPEDRSEALRRRELGTRIMNRRLLTACALLSPSSAAAARLRRQPRRPSSVRQAASLRIVVKDPSGAVIPNARSSVKGTEDGNRGRGRCRPCRPTARASRPSADLAAGPLRGRGHLPRLRDADRCPDVRVRAGDNRREVTLADPRSSTRASRSAATRRRPPPIRTATASATCCRRTRSTRCPTIPTRWRRC